jgi:nucleoside-diphosphate-sugar epimerase
MRVFVTGASGWVGSAVVPELINAGHEVVGLARSDASAAALDAAGARPLPGTIDDLDTLRAAASEADGVVHLAFKHDLAFSGGFEAAVDAERLAVEAFGDALAGTGKPFVAASGIPEAEAGVPAAEDDEPTMEVLQQGGAAGRFTNARFATGLAEHGVRSSVVRLPIVHGEGDPGFTAALVAIARERGASGFIGDGTSRWSAVHRSDAARLFRLALESAAAGSVLHCVADEGVATGEIAAVIGRHLDVPAVPVAPEDAGTHFGWLAAFFAADRAASSTRTRALTGWEPTGPGFLESLEKGHYFEA